MTRTVHAPEPDPRVSHETQQEEVVAHRRGDLSAQWRQVRLAIADELIERLPDTLYLSQIPEVLGVPLPRVLQAVRAGTIVTVGMGARRRMVCADSREFLAFDTSIRLSLPARVRADVERDLTPLDVTVALPPEVHQRLEELSAQRGVPVGRLISEAAIAAYRP